jgi:hypothetical protein
MLTCAFTFNCTASWRDRSIYCAPHHCDVAYRFLSVDYLLVNICFTPLYGKMWRRPHNKGAMAYHGLTRRAGVDNQIHALLQETPPDARVSLQPPRIVFTRLHQTSAYKALRFLHFAHRFLSVWFVDTEFYQPNPPYKPVATQISVRECHTARDIVVSLVNMKSTVSNVAQALGLHHCMQAYALERGLLKVYLSPGTHGLTLSEIGSQMRSAHFSPGSHCVLSWSYIGDCFTFARALAFDTQLLSTITPDRYGLNILQTIDLRHVFEVLGGLKRNTTLSAVHGAVNCVPDSFRYHDPSNDTLSMNDAGHYAQEQTAHWFPQIHLTGDRVKPLFTGTKRDVPFHCWSDAMLALEECALRALIET